MPLLNAILKSSSEGSAGKSLPPTTPRVCLIHLAASFLFKSDGSAGKSLPPTTPNWVLKWIYNVEEHVENKGFLIDWSMVN